MGGEWAQGHPQTAECLSFLGQGQCLQVEFTDPGLLEPGGRTHRKLAAEEGAHDFLAGIPKAVLSPTASTSAMLFWPQHLPVFFCLYVSLHLCPRE